MCIRDRSVPLSIKEALDKVYYPLIEELIAQLKTYATDWADIPIDVYKRQMLNS